MAPESIHSSSGEELDIICNLISVLPMEYDHVPKVAKYESGLAEELANHKHLCYYLMKNGAINEDKAIFERPDYGMQQHLKPLFIWVKVENVGINKVLVNGRASVNIIPHSILRKIGKFDTDLRPHNMVLSNYEGNTCKALAIIQVDVMVGTIVRPTLFMVIPTKANYNLLLGREWTNDVGFIPSTMHQRVLI